MNKALVEKLAVQSLVWVDTGLADGREQIFSTTKFAELIVRECMALHDETIADYRKRRKVADDLVYKDVYAEGEAACVRTRAKIKKHFGVEE